MWWWGETGSVDTDQDQGRMSRPVGRLLRVEESCGREERAGGRATPQPSEAAESNFSKPTPR